MTGRSEHVQAQAAEVDLVTVGQSGVVEESVACGRGQHRGTVVCGQVVCAAEEVGVEVCIGGPADP